LTDWSEQKDWSEPRVGDVIRATRDGGMLTGVICGGYEKGRGDRERSLLIADDVIEENVILRRTEWKLFVLSNPPVAAPTEPGWYYGSKHGKDIPLRLDQHGIWSTAMRNHITPESHMPLLKLEPEAETVAAILQEIRATINSCEGSLCSGIDFQVHMQETVDAISKRYID